jgi:hypothetical protein
MALAHFGYAQLRHLAKATQPTPAGYCVKEPDASDSPMLHPAGPARAALAWVSTVLSARRAASADNTSKLPSVLATQRLATHGLQQAQWRPVAWAAQPAMLGYIMEPDASDSPCCTQQGLRALPSLEAPLRRAHAKRNLAATLSSWHALATQILANPWSAVPSNMRSGDLWPRQRSRPCWGMS